VGPHRRDAPGDLASIDDVAGYKFPDYSSGGDYDPVREHRAERPDKWLIGSVPGFAFNIARKLFKLEDYLVYLLSDLGALHSLHDRIDDMLADMIVNYAAAGADCVMFPEDWGTQTQTLISPALWRQEFFPRFRRLCGLAHERGVKVFMHSCGAIGAIVPGLMAAGVDLLQFDQPMLHGIDTLAEYQQRGKITFWCPVDIQKTLQTREEAKIRAEARELIEKLWRGRGGFIAGYYSGNEAIGLDPRWQEVACDAFVRAGVHRDGGHRGS